MINKLAYIFIPLPPEINKKENKYKPILNNKPIKEKNKLDIKT